MILQKVKLPSWYDWICLEGNVSKQREVSTAWHPALVSLTRTDASKVMEARGTASNCGGLANVVIRCFLKYLKQDNERCHRCFGTNVKKGKRLGINLLLLCISYSKLPHIYRKKRLAWILGTISICGMVRQGAACQGRCTNIFDGNWNAKLERSSLEAGPTPAPELPWSLALLPSTLCGPCPVARSGRHACSAAERFSIK